jgi:hypothetical protein
MVLLEGLLELKDVDEIVARVGGQTDEKPEVDESEDDIAEVGRRTDAPMVEHDARHHAIALEGEVATRFSKLATGNVASLGKPELRELECRENEQIRALVKSRIARAYTLHHAISKSQLRHVTTPGVKRSSSHPFQLQRLR